MTYRDLLLSKVLSHFVSFSCHARVALYRYRVVLITISSSSYTSGSNLHRVSWGQINPWMYHGENSMAWYAMGQIFLGSVRVRFPQGTRKRLYAKKEKITQGENS